MSTKKKVAIIGSGNWGSAIAKIIGVNVTKFAYFDKEVKMYVYEEIVNGSKLSEIINTEHENVKYLKGHRLPDTIVAVPEVVDAAKDADILVFVVPHAFVPRICQNLKGNIKPTAVGISLIKGFGETPNGGIELISDVIKNILSIDCTVLMGANLAGEVADEKFCETTIGSRNKDNGILLKELFQTDNFRVTVVPDTYTVEICGALKNIVAMAAGFSDGLGYGDNTKSAVIRIGLKEMIRFIKTFYPDGTKETTFFESCGVADLITTCYGGRNRKVSEAFVKSDKSIDELEKELLDGQKLQGYQTCCEVMTMLRTNGHIDRFPLIEAVYLIGRRDIPPQRMLEYLRREPEDM
ncbi:glycerol-3-phosphate dehydrogenase [NAD(+)], cytoplasmic-like [Oppia nitens]|uniref:glycerol-3-phosphate dehydrogenase [NAD(+)], cytoplasmic-like n=1 Tax=Oppia nitens TaxID=1686743 RepID=UPI0023DA5D27|nr:glycerol-3-phosphate dehydrogenase [NAD(+)], cytoplasmic-like [Oppia nitens]XP_054161881.1 glycerol-3-phosphate dehydrogenase [NAD(+)], cytoplasmic-like [Oppia nitens]